MSSGVQLSNIHIPAIGTDPEKYAGYQSNTGHLNEGYVLEENEKTLEKNAIDHDKSNDDEQYEESSDDEEELSGAYSRLVYRVHSTAVKGYGRHSRVIWGIVAFAIVAVYFVYFGFAVDRSFDSHNEPIMRLVVFTALLALGLGIKLVSTCCCRDKDVSISYCIDLEHPALQTMGRVIFWIASLGTAAFVIIFIAIDLSRSGRSENLISGLGMVSFVVLFYVFSKNPARVNWRPVFWGLSLQFYLALFILRTNIGYSAFQWLGDRASEFLLHTDAGSKFVFGDDYIRHFFAFKVLTVIIFFSSTVSVLYYLGVMQFIIRYLARFLAFCLGTSPTESLNAAGNIFLGQTEAPLMIRPFINDMTKSELHAVCTGGFATIAGSVMAAYILMDVPANHLLSASVMSAPAALAMSKLFYPETKKSKARAEDVYNMPKGTESNIVEAASNGAAISVKLIANIVANLIAFLAILDFLNTTLIWLGHRILWREPEHEELSFYLICSYVFYPVAWLLGTSNTYCDIRKVARLIGLKTFLNEFVAYAELSTLISNTAMFNEFTNNPNTTDLHNQTILECSKVTLGNGTVLDKGILTDRSIVLATYALCGFSNISSIGIMLGGLGAMAPRRKRDMTKVVVRAMIAGNVACFMTACISGLLYTGPK